MISPTVDASSGTVKVTIEVDRPGRYLRPGMFGKVLIATETHQNALVIPKKAIVRERELNYVYEIQGDQTVSRREVETGFSDENNVEVVSGLEEGTVIVTVGHETLNDGYLVAVKGWDGEVPEGFQVPAKPAAQPPQTQVAESHQGGPQAGRAGFFERILENPEIKKKYEARLADDPTLATDMQKRRDFVREVMPQFRQSQGGQ